MEKMNEKQLIDYLLNQINESLKKTNRTEGSFEFGTVVKASLLKDLFSKKVFVELLNNTLKGKFTFKKQSSDIYLFRAEFEDYRVKESL